MSKKDNIDSFDTSHKSLYISLAMLFPIMFLVAFVIFYLIETILLMNHYSMLEILQIHKKNIAITGICMWALCFYFVLGSLNFTGKTKNLSLIRWATMAEQKEMFAVAPLDTSQHLEVGGAPINMINNHELLYETGDVHDLCLGATRSGKSRKIVRQLVMLASMADEAMIFNDPKKEMYQDFHKYLEKRGYEVMCIDLRNSQYSDKWNPLGAIVYQTELGNTDDAEQYAEDQVTSLVVDNGVGEPIWIEGQKALIKSLILAVANAPIPKSKKNYYSVYQTLAVQGEEIKIDKREQMILSAFMNSLDEGTPAKKSFAPIRNSPDKTRGSFMVSALATLEKFTGQKVARVLSDSDFDFHTYVNGKKALFVVNPDEKKTYNSIASMIFSSAYQALVFEANTMPGRKLKRRVHFILDEFGNMPKIDDIDKLFTVSLSRRVLFHIYLQDFRQLNKTYDDNIATILRSNCALWTFISSNDYDSCEEMSKKIGENYLETVSRTTNADNQGRMTGMSSQVSDTQARKLIRADELMHTDRSSGKDILVSRLNMMPMKVNLPDCSQYPWYKEMEHDEVEVLKNQKPAEYAIPRYIVLSYSIMAGAGIKLRLDGESQIAPKGAGKEEPLLSKNMYWYWSTRGDLEGAVFTHVIDYLKKIDLIESKIPVQIIIRSYMKSDEFIQWLWSIDSNDDEKNLDEVKRNLDEIEITDNDNAFSDAWS